MIYSPSLMCANFDNLKDEAQSLEAAGATRLHLDVMDGQYVPNFALGLGDVKSVCRNTTIATEVHMMIQEPARFVQMFADAGVDIMYFHPDSASHPLTVVQKIRQTGKKPGIVINPEVTIESMLQFYDLVDNVLVMGVEPGYAGRIYLSHVDQKLDKLLELKDKYNLEIIIDGACSVDRMKRWSKQGVDGFVLGTSSLFGHEGTYKEIIDHIKQECGD
ncbi:MAG: ribulose-phosphate 3-epimerase [Muribaculaceae bacterium]|nr:ribulose-phosphate 3-epimerase [Muribaculaceae bacterium]